jgi:hypothetical protein
MFKAREGVIDKSVSPSQERFQPEAKQFGKPAAAIRRDKPIRFIHNDSVHLEGSPGPDQVGCL